MKRNGLLIVIFVLLAGGLYNAFMHPATYKASAEPLSNSPSHTEIQLYDEHGTLIQKWWAKNGSHGWSRGVAFTFVDATRNMQVTVHGGVLIVTEEVPKPDEPDDEDDEGDTDAH